MHSNETAMDNELTEDEASVQRWRNAVLRLSEAMVTAAGARADLSALLLEALNNALENLLLYGEEADLALLEEWLDDGDFAPYVSPEPAPAVNAASYSLFSGRKEAAELREAERRNAAGRRKESDRRSNDERRAASSTEAPVPDERRSGNQRRIAERRTQRDRRS